ncbi:hypothetical protein [Roseateles asaccharophilus]|uniref:Uncharacterized protein n=1 Tax=Roseateles asaccharophilus TaxID=582607 RepID=A0ABU2AC61_9BURK|nr:hypothetical protein [Roseateles asaccharophilus]MDR7334595.1 hypothetical protein [Roseateles asaccharophilus]
MSARPALPPHLAPTTLAAVDTDSVGFDELRARGLTLLQKLSGRVWTDHNLHDPGITLLEQLCFGLTDIVYRAGFPVADHLTGPDGRIDHADQSLHPPSEALPCRPTTIGDYRRHLLDALPELDDATLEPDPGTGLYRLRLKFRAGLGAAVQARIAAARAACLARRNLGEDLDPEVICLREVPCDLHADVEIGGPRDAVDILAEVYDRCARYIANVPRSRTLDELRREGSSLEEIYSGPAVRHGFIDDDKRASSGGSQRTLALSELVGLVRDVPGVLDARLLALQVQGQETTAASVVWRDRDSALALRLPDHEVPATITVRRRGNVVPVAWQDLRRRLGDLQAGGRAQRARTDQQQAERADALMPQGRYRAMQGYSSVQDHLPALYGLGRHGPGPSAPPKRQAEVKQLKAYLVMQEQAMAQGLAQLAHLRELFSVAPDATQGLWTQMIGPDAVPGVDKLYLQPLAQVADTVYKPFDSSFERKNRALDHLLALHGETYTQNSMRQFFGHYKPREAERLLLENKATWLRDIVPLTRDRASGFDPGRESWNRRDNCSGMQRRASLLLGFKHWHDRPLTQVLREERLQPVRQPDDRHHAWQLNPHDPDLPQALAVGSAVKPADMRQLREDLERLPWLREPLPGGLWRAAQQENRYRLLDGADGARLLVLGPDENGRWWRLGSFRDAATARRTAASLRLYLRGVDQACEGLHLVEHVLLRPLHRDTSRHDRLGLVPGFYRLAVTTVLPNWTQRTARVAFRRFARETLRLSCPAHLTLHHLPLDAARMQGFETVYAAWLEARRAWCQRPTDEVLQWSADGHACELITLMRSAHRVLAKAWTRKDEGGDEAPPLQGHA